MARRTITRELYDALVDGYAATPHNNAAAARFAHCDPRTAQRAWATGWPQYTWARPICEVHAERQAAARALAVERERDATAAAAAGVRSAAATVHTQALTHAAQQIDQEAQLAKGVRQNALFAIGLSLKLLQKGIKLSEDLTAEELKALPAREKVRVLKSMSEFAKDSAACAEAAVKLERMILGAPTEVVTHQHIHVEVQPQDMATTIMRAQAALERASAAGIIDIEATAVPG